MKNTFAARAFKPRSFAMRSIAGARPRPDYPRSCGPQAFVLDGLQDYVERSPWNRVVDGLRTVIVRNQWGTVDSGLVTVVLNGPQFRIDAGLLTRLLSSAQATPRPSMSLQTRLGTQNTTSQGSREEKC